MLGVDVADQLMPMMFHCLNIIQINAVIIIIIKSLVTEKVEHKEFVAEFISVLLDRASNIPFDEMT